ncbi:hypothetical protein TA3x_000512 [Tundrisphaera sp. TA3]|uniref:hypothetical protein n=1 Tax=Tundrisphaera sp. TA3 TaxID=3435775 RepID=UPI003EBC891E
MTPEELRPIVIAWGGVEKFAARIKAKPRTVYCWLDGTRRIRPTVEELIGNLKNPVF